MLFGSYIRPRLLPRTTHMKTLIIPRHCWLVTHTPAFSVCSTRISILTNKEALLYRERRVAFFFFGRRKKKKKETLRVPRTTLRKPYSSYHLYFFKKNDACRDVC